MGKTRAPLPADSNAEAHSPQVQAEAKRLLEESGTPDLARQAVPTAAPAARGTHNDDFAHSWGFASYLEMFEASKPIMTDGDRHWLVSNVGPDRWIAWNDLELSAVGPYAAADQAAAHIPASLSPAPAPPPPTG
jgi:hypothetical protein